jgi:ribonuclease E
MLDDEPRDTSSGPDDQGAHEPRTLNPSAGAAAGPADGAVGDAPTAPRRRRSAAKTSVPRAPDGADPGASPPGAAAGVSADSTDSADSRNSTAARPATRARRTRAAAASTEPQGEVEASASHPVDPDGAEASPAPRRRSRARGATSAKTSAADAAVGAAEAGASGASASDVAGSPAVPAVLFRAPELAAGQAQALAGSETLPGPDGDTSGEDSGDAATPRRRRGRRGGRSGRGAGAGEVTEAAEGTDAAADGGDGGKGSKGGPGSRGSAVEAAEQSADEAAGDDTDETGGDAARRRRRRRRRRSGEAGADSVTLDENGVETVVHVREARPAKKAGADDDSGVRGVKGSTRLEAKRQRRREGRDTGRRRTPIITEAEFLARRESVERVMVVRQGSERTQIGVLEDGVLVEHYVARKDHTSMVGNVFLGKVQNVLPSMEAAFVDIGRGRNAVLYAGEVNYDASALEGRAPRIEQALKSGQSVLVQVTKDPIGHKGARLTSQVSLPGRYMVYVPDGRLSGISRKLPDTERTRLKGILKRLMPEEAGVIIRTAAEGASEEELERDLKRLQAQWEDIEKKAQTASAPAVIYGEPDVVIRVIRDIFNEDFAELVVSGDDEWDTVDNYVRWVAPDLAPRARKWTESEDVFAAYRIDEQLAKALDRKVWLPSGGYLVIDRTEAMIVVDVNTGRFTGKGGGNLEETVTKNNLEAAEEIVRQLRLRDLGGIIVIDFIDMVLESNRDLVLRRLMECLGRDRTRHQVAEVTSLGLVQMTRKRVGQGLLEAFSEPCKECGGRGVILTLDPVAEKRPKTKPKPQPPLAPAPAPATEAVAAVDGEEPGGSTSAGRRSRGGRSRRAGAAVADTVIEAAAEPVAEVAAEVAAEPAAEPIAEAAAEPIAEAAAEPIAEAVAEPVAEPIAGAVAEPVGREV